MGIHRAILPALVLRTVRIEGLSFDERMAVAPMRESRSRLCFVLEGELWAFHAGRVLHLTAGDLLTVPAIGAVRTRSDDLVVLELDFDSSGLECSAPQVVQPNAALIESAGQFSGLLASRRTRLGDLSRAARALLAAFEGAGLPLVPKCFDSAGLVSEAERTLLAAIDNSLERLADHPDVADLEGFTGWSRRTVHRHLRAFSDKYRMYQGSQDWRARRDFYRRLVALFYLSHPDASTKNVYALVGYRSASALCHAFRNAGLPPPNQVRSRLRDLAPA